MKIKEVALTLERFAPLPLQESYDNAGLQVGLTEAEASGVLLCLDVTEDVVHEAVRRGCNVVVAHHPLLFSGLKRISDETMIERCVRTAILNGVTLYAAHTNLDNARGGVNFDIAKRLGLKNVDFLVSNGEGGSGVIGLLDQPMPAMDFLKFVKDTFHVECLMHNCGTKACVQKIALCGGAGGFLLNDALVQKADVFLTGEMSYHNYFGLEDKIWIGVLGHYQSEQFTIELMAEILKREVPQLRVEKVDFSTNPINYMV